MCTPECLNNVYFITSFISAIILLLVCPMAFILEKLNVDKKTQMAQMPDDNMFYEKSEFEYLEVMLIEHYRVLGMSKYNEVFSAIKVLRLLRKTILKQSAMYMNGSLNRVDITFLHKLINRFAACRELLSLASPEIEKATGTIDKDYVELYLECIAHMVLIIRRGFLDDVLGRIDNTSCDVVWERE